MTDAHHLLRSIDSSVVESVARCVLDDRGAQLTADPVITELDVPRVDLRTLGIWRYVGSARSTGAHQRWSAVVKVIDVEREPGPAAGWVNPELEELVYEHRLFTGTATNFRPANCYLVQRFTPSIKALWLEDLTLVKSANFTLDEHLPIARHVGEFNGVQITAPEELPFRPVHDSHFKRWTERNLSSELAKLSDIADSEETVRTYGDVSVSEALELGSVRTQSTSRISGDSNRDWRHGHAANSESRVVHLSLKICLLSGAEICSPFNFDDLK